MHWGGWAGQVPPKACRLQPTWSPCLQGLARDSGSVCSQLQVSPFWSRHRVAPGEDGDVSGWGGGLACLTLAVWSQVSAKEALACSSASSPRRLHCHPWPWALEGTNKPPNLKKINPLPLSQRTASWEKEKKEIQRGGWAPGRLHLSGQAQLTPKLTSARVRVCSLASVASGFFLPQGL